jgi:hypothetical protein
MLRDNKVVLSNVRGHQAKLGRWRRVLGNKIGCQITLGGENLLKCTTQDEKGLVLIVVLFYLIF